MINQFSKPSSLNQAPIIFVWLGRKLPRYAKYFLEFAHFSNPNVRTILVSNYRHKLDKNINNIETVFLHKKTLLNLKSISAPDSFFFNTSARFIYLSKAMEKLHITSCFHAELDNAVFNLDGLQQSLDRINPNCLFVPKDTQSRGVASLIYCNNRIHIENLVKIIISNDLKVDNDMDAIGVFAKLYPDIFMALPTESFFVNKFSWKIATPCETKGIFDAASLGQYLLGTNNPYFPNNNIFNLYINENCKINLAELRFQLYMKQLYVVNLCDSKIKLYNLHVHSKSFTKFQSLLTHSDFLYNVNSGQKLLIGGKANVIVLFLLKLKFKLKSVFGILKS